MECHLAIELVGMDYCTPRITTSTQRRPAILQDEHASLFTIWDRLFGQVDPDSVKTKVSFGTGEKVNPLRVVLGI